MIFKDRVTKREIGDDAFQPAVLFFEGFDLLVDIGDRYAGDSRFPPVESRLADSILPANVRPIDSGFSLPQNGANLLLI